MSISWQSLRLVVAVMIAATASGAPPATSARQLDTVQYEDPAGRFSVPIPTNWTVEERDGFAVLSDPDGDLTVTIIVVPADGAEAAIGEAIWTTGVALEETWQPPTAQELPSERGVDETVVVTQLSDDQLSFLQAVGQRVGGDVYVMIFAGTVDAAARRNAQIQTIANGFAIGGIDAVDLSGRQPMPLSDDLLAELDIYARDLLEQLDIPGASIAIVENGRIAYAKGIGVAQAGTTEPVTADTRMMIGSVTKSMTTLMMATEVDDGLMAWDQPVVEILPEFAVADPELTETITVRNLVCACTGVPRRDLEFIFNASELSAEDTIASLAEFEFLTGFGETFQYSNQMVATGGYVAAAAAGGEFGELFDAYAEQMQARVFDPIGMPGTTLSFEDVEQSGAAAAPHGMSIEAEYVPIALGLEETLRPVAPAGLVWSTANDMARYLITLLQRGIGPDGNRVVSEVNLTETWEPQVQVDADVSYGLGWLLEDYHGVPVIHHGGNTFGFTSDLAFLPEAGVGIVVLANSQAAGAFTQGIRFRLLELLYEQPFSFQVEIDYALEQSAEAYEAMMAQVTDVPAGIARLAEGRYESDVLGTVTLTVERGDLILDAGEFASRLLYVGGSTTEDRMSFMMADPPLVGGLFDLTIDADGVGALELDIGTDRYVVHAADAATPVALRGIASPIAA